MMEEEVRQAAKEAVQPDSDEDVEMANGAVPPPSPLTFPQRLMWMAKQRLPWEV